MTTELGRLCSWLAGAFGLTGIAVVALSCASTNKLRHGDTIDVSSYPKDIQEAYEVFAVRCSRCHTVARPLNARIHDPQHWIRYVARMRRNPTSGINEKDAAVILRFLLYYMHQRDAQEARDSESEPAPELSSPAPTPANTEPANPNVTPEPAALQRRDDPPAPPQDAPTPPTESSQSTPAAEASQPQTPAVAPQRSP